MRRKQYDEFYFTKDCKIHTVDKVQEQYEKNNGDISYFQGEMRCPECKKAVLSFTRKTSRRSEYLSKEPSSSHLENCSYKNDYASKKQIIEYVETMSDSQIQDKLESALNILMNRDIILTNNSIESQKQVDNPLIIKRYRGNTIQRTIPRKSLGMFLNKEDEGKVFIFYGTVKLKVEPVKEFFRLLIYNKRKDGTWGYKTKVFRGKIEDRIDENKEYDIAILGHLYFYKDGKLPEIKTIKPATLYYTDK